MIREFIFSIDFSKYWTDDNSKYYRYDIDKQEFFKEVEIDSAFLFTHGILDADLFFVGVDIIDIDDDQSDKCQRDQNIIQDRKDETVWFTHRYGIGIII